MEHICSKLQLSPNVLLITIPIIWGIYEFKKLVKSLHELNEKAAFFQQKLILYQLHLSNISNKQFDNVYEYPFLTDFNKLVEKANTILK
tara:strand:+ start:534 stop:800 length:267 start_codon:yes stop_codon:yes gene_type:complete